jgi:hypothetical protein
MDDIDAHRLFHKAIETANDSPREALPLAREALRAFRWVRCYRIRSASLLAHILVDLREFERSEKIFLAAYRVATGCPCCLPVLHRESALLLSAQEKHMEAIERATLAVEQARGGNHRALCTLSRGTVYDNAHDERAAKDFTESLASFPPESACHRLALRNLARTLSFGKSTDLEAAFLLLPKLEESYKGVRLASPERAWLAWLEGAILAKKAESATGHARRTFLARSRDAHAKAYRKFIKQGLRESADAVWCDMCAVQTQLDRARVPGLLKEYGFPEAFASEVASIEHWIASKEKRAASELLRILGSLREATAFGPSLVSYYTK